MRGSAKTLEQHLRDGSFRVDRHGHLLPAGGLESLLPPSAAPAKPAGLSPSESAQWDRLIGGGLELRAEDGPLLLEFVRWGSRADAVGAALDRMSPTDKAFGELLKAAGIATDMLLSLSQRFGLSPADRGKLLKKAGVRDSSSPAGSSKVATRPRTKLDKSGAKP